MLVGFHELGHYSISRLFSVPVEKFIVSPLGGFIKFKENFDLNSLAVYKRFCIFLAGPVFNLILAFFAYWVVFYVGIAQPAPIIGQITPHSLAANSGISAGNKIIAIDNHAVSTWPAVVFRILPHLGENSEIIIQTADQNKNNIKYYKILANNFKLDDLRPDLLLALGIIPEKNSVLNLRKYDVIPAMNKSVDEIKFYLYINAVVIKKMFTGDISIRALVGPIGLLSSSFYAAKQGWIFYIAFIGFLSIGLAFINLLPIPGLDGAHIFYLFIEFFRGRPLSSALQMLLFRLGIILLTVLMIQAIMNDLSRLS